MKKLVLLAMAAMLTTAAVSTTFAQEKEKCNKECCKKCPDKCKEACKNGKCTKEECGKCEEKKSCCKEHKHAA
jgi:hypothetical protein